eukprot:scaffold7500_cov127-Isochrysis_galbana.AAC.8
MGSLSLRPLIVSPLTLSAPSPSLPPCRHLILHDPPTRAGLGTRPPYRSKNKTSNGRSRRVLSAEATPLALSLSRSRHDGGRIFAQDAGGERAHARPVNPA